MVVQQGRQAQREGVGASGDGVLSVTTEDLEVGAVFTMGSG
jgi:hypothetical protein